MSTPCTVGPAIGHVGNAEEADVEATAGGELACKMSDVGLPPVTVRRASSLAELINVRDPASRSLKHASDYGRNIFHVIDHRA